MTSISARENDRSDGVERKLALLATAYAAGNRDLAASLAESIKDTIGYERVSLRGLDAKADSGADSFVRVDDLPEAWAGWAKGWRFVKAVALFETTGQERAGEPTTIRLGIRPEQAADPRRELRVARIESDGGLRETPCQVDGLARDRNGWWCRLLISADVPAHGRATYLIFCGNPFAERPEFITDLRVRGEGYGLEIANAYYVAQLSKQEGQLERLISKRQHGLELYAGGKGHGEPPGIDWGHDYVDQGNFQKLRMRNWAECPNYEVEVGPLAVRVRRWGFPHSPIHPVFTPSRIHMDQSYTFHAGQPYFFKESRFDVVRDVDIEAMRDDEWVFSGYSFNETLWIDRTGRLHEGPVPPAEANALWGVGFRHKDSRDAFLALWLDHSAEGFDAIGHNGSPTLNYDGHGQLWSRYPAHKASLKAGTVLRQKNAYQLFAYPEKHAGPTIEALRQRLLHPVEIAATEIPRVPARAEGALARPGEVGEPTALKKAVWDTLRSVRDEQLYTADANVVDLGLIYDVKHRHGAVQIVMTMPHRGRPVHDFFVTQGGGRVEDGIRERLLRLKGVREVVVDLTWNPPWTPALITDAGRRTLGLQAF